ncbi:monooxygenase [Fusarium globosum]|uniref:Monooxygenase n=1 Tax=Fusarium globosum TaxID=78864 RepID=A0A8H6DKQ6_9HYPO|nr:monooxygenase [Fusarium globosum]
MDETQVIIVGGGPAGLALGLSLARLKIHSVILEKEAEITTDPRGVFLTGDAVRILHSLGINDLMGIGHEMPHLNFHLGAFNTPPFFSIRIGDINSLEQALPEGILQMQPRLEGALRKAIEESKFCSLRTACEVVAVQEAGLASIISKEAIVVYDAQSDDSSLGQKTLSDTNGRAVHLTVCSPSQIAAAGGYMANRYDSSVFVKRLGRGTKFAIIRLDFFIFACSSDYAGLVSSLELLRGFVGFGVKR